jgi:uncharacterized cupredoxin-like copper-binding protein
LRLRLISLIALISALLVTSVAIASTRNSSVIVPIKITATLKDYSFHFSRLSVPKGSTVVFTVKNRGATAHNIDFVGTGKRSPVLAAGKTTTLKIVFKKRGVFQVVCDVPRHIQLGMVSTFKVK